MVEFNPTKSGRYKETTYQDTFISDIISYTDSIRHAVQQSDTVLAPRDSELVRYAPATVIQGHESRDGKGDLHKPLNIPKSVFVQL